MKKYHTSSTERGKCFKCKKISSIFCTLSESGIDIRIPTCDEHYNLIYSNDFISTIRLIKLQLKNIDLNNIRKNNE